jgi:hypothetical protein
MSKPVRLDATEPTLRRPSGIRLQSPSCRDQHSPVKDDPALAAK